VSLLHNSSSGLTGWLRWSRRRGRRCAASSRANWRYIAAASRTRTATSAWQEYVIAGRDFTVRRADTGEEPSSFIQSIILTYLVTADGTTPSSRWVGFRELPDGLFYVQAFQGYTGDRLVRELGGGIEAFRRAGERLGGGPLEIGDAGYVFRVLPRVHLGLVYWEGDEEFPSQARVLFEDTAAHYMPTDGLAILGSQLVGRMLKAAQDLGRR